MINRSHRFHGYGSLRSVYQRGQTVRGPLISLKFAQRDPKKSYRVAVVVSRKVNKSAVARNRIRRRIYETVRQNQTIPSGFDMVFTVFSDEIRAMENTQLTNNLNSMINKALRSNSGGHDIVNSEGKKI